MLTLTFILTLTRTQAMRQLPAEELDELRAIADDVRSDGRDKAAQQKGRMWYRLLSDAMNKR